MTTNDTNPNSTSEDTEGNHGHFIAPVPAPVEDVEGNHGHFIAPVSAPVEDAEGNSFRDAAPAVEAETDDDTDGNGRCR
ncbi:MAG TPA: hypothetical protein VGO03_12765 [Acidimicrobiia bacterium]